MVFHFFEVSPSEVTLCLGDKKEASKFPQTQNKQKRADAQQFNMAYNLETWLMGIVTDCVITINCNK